VQTIQHKAAEQDSIQKQAIKNYAVYSIAALR